jgi:hypothetical protein
MEIIASLNIYTTNYKPTNWFIRACNNYGLQNIPEGELWETIMEIFNFDDFAVEKYLLPYYYGIK